MLLQIICNKRTTCKSGKDRIMTRNKGMKLLLLVGIMAGITLISIIITYGIHGPQKRKKDNISIVTSFYPMYIAALNLTDGINGVTVENLLNLKAGCPHDYQLNTSDMKKLEKADLLLINGAGMESYVEEVALNYPDLMIVDSSENIRLLEGEEHTHEGLAEHQEEEEGHHEHGNYNGHIWMDPTRYMMQLENITKGLIAADSTHEDEYEANLKAYKQKIIDVWKQYEALGESTESQVIIFHDAMEYLMNRLNIKVPYSIDIDGETSLSAGEIAEVIEEVKEHNIKVLFIEEQFDTNIANRIAEETGALVYVLDTMVSGENEKDAYIDSMTTNLAIIKEALYQ